MKKKEFNESKLRKKLKKNKMSKRQKYIIKKTIICLSILIFLCVSVILINKARVLRVEIRGLNNLSPMRVIEEANLPNIIIAVSLIYRKGK